MTVAEITEIKEQSTKSIKERAEVYVFNKMCHKISLDSHGETCVWNCPSNDCDNCKEYWQAVDEYIEIATEQDIVAREEERQRTKSLIDEAISKERCRCEKAVKKALCDPCDCFADCGEPHGEACTYGEHNCRLLNNIKSAIRG